MNFTKSDAKKLLTIIKARRDVRGNRFLQKQVEQEKLKLILDAALHAPSVGYSQPWRFIVIENSKIKRQIAKSFAKENQKAKEIFAKRALYSQLKLEGIMEAPVNIAVLYEPKESPVLGMTSINRVGEYSVVCAVQNMWLMARALNIGMGWVSILDEGSVLEILKAKKGAKLIAYLCLGYVDFFYHESELKMLQWESTKSFNECVEFL